MLDFGYFVLLIWWQTEKQEILKHSCNLGLSYLDETIIINCLTIRFNVFNIDVWQWRMHTRHYAQLANAKLE